jgi:hypothetical protein
MLAVKNSTGGCGANEIESLVIITQGLPKVLYMAVVWCTHIFAEVSLTMNARTILSARITTLFVGLGRGPQPRLPGSTRLAWTQSSLAARRNTKGSPPDCWTACLCGRYGVLYGVNEEALRRSEALGGAAALRCCDWTRLRHRALHLERCVLVSSLPGVDGFPSKGLSGLDYYVSKQQYPSQRDCRQ